MNQPCEVFYSLNDMPENFTGLAYLTLGEGRFWFKNGKIHREDGPARIDDDGDTYWYKEEKNHRVNGPARIWTTKNINYYFINGDYLEEEEYWCHPLVVEYKVHRIINDEI